MLEAGGLSFAEETVYLAMVRRPDLTPAELAAQAGLDDDGLAAVLARLAGLGLASRDVGTDAYHAVPPDVATELLVAHRRAELRKEEGDLERLRELGAELARHYAEAAVPDGRLGVVTVVNEGLRPGDRLEMSAQREILVWDRPPYSQSYHHGSEFEDEKLAAGVRCRVLYDRATLDMPSTRASAEKFAAAGEEARVLPRLALKAAIFDRELVYIPLRFAGGDLADYVVMTNPMLVEAFVEYFELLWERATPFTGSAPDSPLTAADRTAIAMMAAGSKDAAIARHLGVSLPTVRRRISTLMAELGADTRFQAGVEAARRGWLG